MRLRVLNALTATIADPAGIPPGARALAAVLAVLRRPQTARDRLPARAGRTLSPAIVPIPTRLVATCSERFGRVMSDNIIVLVGVVGAVLAHENCW